MVTQAAQALCDGAEVRWRELSEAVVGLDEAVAAQRPADGEWCVKEVLTHLIGDEGLDVVAGLRRFIEEDTPLIGVVAGLPYYTPRRQAMNVGQLLDALQEQQRRVIDFLGGLTEEQLSRKGRVPVLRETPLGEYPTLAQFVGAIINFHWADHINQVRKAIEQVRGQG